MSVEFRLGNNDHKKVEDFIARDPSGVTAITLDTKGARHQNGAAEAARHAGIDVLFEPATERLAVPGYDLSGIFGLPSLLDIGELSSNQRSRLSVVDAVIAGHPDSATKVTPAHFYVTDERSARLNVALAEETRIRQQKPVRACLIISRKFAELSAEWLAAEYVSAGITEVEIRISPLGGEDEGLAKIRSVFTTLDVYSNAGLTLTLGQSGNIGATAVALGHATHYSVGVGMREKVNHAAALNRQRREFFAEAADGDSQGGGPVAGIYLPGIAATVSPRLGTGLLANTDIRGRIGCRVGECGQSINGPAHDPRGHYLHARAEEMSAMEAQPPAWRAKADADRLTRALELRRLINSDYLPGDSSHLKTRTIESLIQDIHEEAAELSA